MNFQENGRFTWRYLPQNLTVKKDALSFTTLPSTDLWYTPDAHRDNGHFCFTNVDTSFVATVQITGNYSELYDQMGFMLRKNNKQWIKLGIEYFDNMQHVSTVVTDDKYSDWNVSKVLQVTTKKDSKTGVIMLNTQFNPKTLYIRMTRLMEINNNILNNRIICEYSFDNNKYTFLRKFYFGENVRNMEFGLMACSPIRKIKSTVADILNNKSFNVKFNNFEIQLLNEEQVKQYKDPVPDPIEEDSSVQTSKRQSNDNEDQKD